MTLRCSGSGGKNKGLRQKQIGTAAALEALVEANLQKRIREVPPPPSPDFLFSCSGGAACLS